jgi:hypothetical protein
MNNLFPARDFFVCPAKRWPVLAVGQSDSLAVLELRLAAGRVNFYP